MDEGMSGLILLSGFTIFFVKIQCKPYLHNTKNRKYYEIYIKTMNII